MSFYAGAIRDPRVREFVPCKRIVFQKDVLNADRLVGNPMIQPVLENTFGSFTVLEPGSSLILDFGLELHGGVRIINSDQKRKFRLRFGESVSEVLSDPDQDHAIHDEILHLPSCGLLEYGNTAFRFVRIDAIDHMELRNVLAVALFRDLPRRGFFECSDPLLNEIWDKSVYTLFLNMQEYLFDGVKRDRLVWAGDLYVEICSTFAAFGNLDIIPETLDFAVRHTPDLHKLGGIPSFSLWWVIALEKYLYLSGNCAFLERERDVVEDLGHFAAGLVDASGRECIGEMRFLDWYSHYDEAAKHAGLQGLLFRALGVLEDLFRRLSLDPAEIVSARERIRSAQVPDCGYNPGAAAMQTLSGLKDCRGVLANHLPEQIDMFSSFFVLQTLPLDAVLSLLKRQWGGMLRMGATTFWEEFDISCLKGQRIDELPSGAMGDIFAGSGDHCYAGTRRSLCHGWGSGPAAILPERLFDLRFPEPGCKSIAVSAPEVEGLSFIRCAVPVADGEVLLNWENGKLDVKAPTGTQVVIS